MWMLWKLMTLNVRTNVNESTNLSSLANKNSPYDDEWVAHTGTLSKICHWCRWGDSFSFWLTPVWCTSTNPSLRSGSVPLLRPPRTAHPDWRTRPYNLSPSWRSAKQFEGHVKAETDKSLLLLARHKRADSSVCWTNYCLLAESSCEFSQWWRFLWPPAVLCDPGAQGDKTAITLLYPPAHYQAGCRICASPRGAAAGRTAACHPDPAAAGRLAGRHAGSR